jgi:hypothetical protein
VRRASGGLWQSFGLGFFFPNIEVLVYGRQVARKSVERIALSQLRKELDPRPFYWPTPAYGEVRPAIRLESGNEQIVNGQFVKRHGYTLLASRHTWRRLAVQWSNE